MRRCSGFFVLIMMLGAMCVNAPAQTPVWTATYGNGPYSSGAGIIEAGDGGFFILGNEGSSSNTKIHIIKTDSLGDISWEKVIGTNAVYRAEDFKRTIDNGFIIAGYTNKYSTSSWDVLVIKTDSNANVEWERTFGGNDWDMAHAVLALGDTTYVVTGETYSYGYGNSDIYTLRLDAGGDTLWTRVLGGDSADVATCMDIAPGGSFYIGANTKSFGKGDYDGLLIKMDLAGDTLWTRVYGDTLEDLIYAVRSLPDSGFIFAGSTENFGSVKHDNWVMRFFPDGSLMWSLPQPWTIGAEEDYVFGIALADSNRYVFAGYTTSAGFGGKEASLRIMGEYFDFRCSYSVGSVWDDQLTKVLYTKDSGCIAVGVTNGMGPSLSNILVVKSDRDCAKDPAATHISALDESGSNFSDGFHAYPQISDGLFTVYCNLAACTGMTVFDVYNVLGQPVHSFSVACGQGTIDLRGMPSGVYLLKMSHTQLSSCLKLIVQKN